MWEAGRLGRWRKKRNKLNRTKAEKEGKKENQKKNGDVTRKRRVERRM
jgi:hypothetical protein